MSTTQVLQYLRKHGQRLDREIAEDTGIPLKQIRFSVAELTALKEISNCSVIHYINGKPIEGILCRVSGYIPPAAPGRKAAVK
ncbi:MAG: ArsR family transcriptional regulator [Methylophilaceae bacterium]|nr:ArsR family transcriptional regulator [Methylophilaceae bacterium]